MPNEDYLLEESVLKLAGLRDITAEEIKAKKESGPIPSQNKQSNYYQTSISPSFQHDTSFVGTEVASPRYPKTAIMPLGIQGNPVSNAAIQSTAQKIVDGHTTTSKIQLQVPDIFTPTDQTVTLPGPLKIGLALELPNTVFAGPSAAFQGQDTAATAEDHSSTILISGTPLGTNDRVILITAQNFFDSGSDFNPGAPWSQTFGPIGNISTTLRNSLFTTTAGAAGTALSATGSITTPADWASVMLFVSSGLSSVTTPSFVQGGTQSGGSTGTLTLTGVTVGHVLIFIAQASNPTLGPFSMTVGDGVNVWDEVVSTQSFVGGGAQVTVWATTVTTGGTLNVQFATSPNVGGGFFNLMEMSGTGDIPGLPSFRALVSRDLPAVNLARPGNGGVIGILPIANGGTGVDLTLTGGTHKFLKQASVGSVITVVQPTYQDLTGLVTTYNGGTLVSNGFPGIISEIISTALTADVVLANLVASTPALGMYEVNFYVVVNQPAGTSSALPNLTIQWLDDTGVTQSASFQAATPTGNLGTTLFSGKLILWASAASAIKYLTGDVVPYASVGSPAMSFNVRIKVEQL